MQIWTVKRDGPLWQVLHNGEAVERFHTEKKAWISANRRANTSAQKRGVTPALIGDEIVVAGDDSTDATRQASRRQRHKEAACIAGYTSIDRLVSAIIAGQATIVRRDDQTSSN